jgi:hypothetical protein
VTSQRLLVTPLAAPSIIEQVPLMHCMIMDNGYGDVTRPDLVQLYRHFYHVASTVS